MCEREFESVNVCEREFEPECVCYFFVNMHASDEPGPVKVSECWKMFKHAANLCRAQSLTHSFTF